ncbi:hypothetical protein BGX29_009420 [Mortierella sp. GBA35]|nr:hypothetical protein BGX29_009420 [Mortierella sp. GBA35]
MGNRPTNNSRPSAEKTPANSVIIQLKNSVKKAFHPSATEKDRTLTNGMAAIYFEQSRFLNRLGRFSMDEPGMDDPEQGQVILDDAQSGRNKDCQPCFG